MPIKLMQSGNVQIQQEVTTIHSHGQAADFVVDALIHAFAALPSPMANESVCWLLADDDDQLSEQMIQRLQRATPSWHGRNLYFPFGSAAVAAMLARPQRDERFWVIAVDWQQPDAQPQTLTVVWSQWQSAASGLRCQALSTGTAGQSLERVVAGLFAQLRPQLRGVVTGCLLPSQDSEQWCGAFAQLAGAVDATTDYRIPADDESAGSAVDGLQALLQLEQQLARRWWQGQALQLCISRRRYAGALLGEWQGRAA